MQLRELRFFVAVAEELNFSRAAERCHVAQPPLSRAIAALEHNLGTPLFNRNTRQVSLTAAGQALLEPARQTLHAAQRARTAVRLSLGEAVEHIGIGIVSPEYAQLDPLHAITRNLETQASVSIEYHALQANDAVLGVREGRLSAAVVFAPVEGNMRGLQVLPLRQDRLVAVVNSEHPLALSTEIELHRLDREQLILFPRHVMPEKFDEITGWFRRSRKRPQWIQGAGSLRLDVQLAADARGIALLPEGPASLYVDARVQLHPVINPALLWNVVLVCRPSDAPRFQTMLKRTLAITEAVEGHMI